MTIRSQDGFTLVEIIMVTILLGIIAVYSSLFVISGVSGYVTAMENTELAQKAGMALTRISIELGRELKAVSTLSPVGTASKTYIKFAYENAPDSFSPKAYRHIRLVTTSDPDRYELLLAAGDAQPVAGDDTVLLDNVKSFALVFLKSDGVTEWTTADATASDPLNGLATISVTLTLYVNDVDADTRDFATTFTPPLFDDVIST